MPEMKGITVKIPADLHAEVKAYLEAHGMTMGEFIAQAVDNELHPKIQITQEDKNMERMRTLAFQVPDSLFQRVKAYLEAHGMTMGEFITQAVDNELHPKIQMTQEEPMERMRTLAFQVPDSLFQRVKAYSLMMIPYQPVYHRPPRKKSL